MNKTKIDYLTHTWNPIAMRCTPISEGCANCWHRRMANRLAGNKSFSEEVRKAYAGDGPPVLIQKRLEGPMHRKKPTRFGVQFMGDLFHESVPPAFTKDMWRVMMRCSEHTFLVLSKRPRRMGQFLRGWYTSDQSFQEIPSNVWLGVSVENQAAADERREYLRRTPAAVKFVSYEPALGPVDWTGWEFVDQIISGGESGLGARPSHPNWHRNTRDFCQANGIAYFFKQWGEWIPESQIKLLWTYVLPWPVKDKDILEIDGETFYRVGKGRAGHLLDGKEWREFPNVG